MYCAKVSLKLDKKTDLESHATVNLTPQKLQIIT